MFGFGEPSELKNISDLLMPGEVLDNEFKYAKAISCDNIFGILVITNRRILFVGKSLFQNRTDDYLFCNVVSVSSATMFPMASHHNVTITSKGDTAIYKNVSSNNAKAFVRRARELIFASTQPVSQAVTSIDDNYIYCMKCGHKLPNKAFFCMKCGEKLIK